MTATPPDSRIASPATKESGTAPKFHFVQDYERHVANLLAAHPIDEAMSLAVGGQYRETGGIQADLLQHLGLKSGMALFDLGCGSGRLSSALGGRMAIIYSGTDVVQSLLDYAKSKAPAEYRFELHCALSIPEADAAFDIATAFSVFTHLLHEETYIYLEHMSRILRPGGRIVFSFLEFAAADHWNIFASTVAEKKSGTLPHLNVFIERPVIACWAQKLGLEVAEFIDAMQAPWGGAPLGQAIAVLRKPRG